MIESSQFNILYHISYYNMNQKSILISLKNEFQKCTGFSYPEDVRTVSSLATSYLADEDIPLPIYNMDCPIISALGAIFNCTRAAKPTNSILPHLIDSLQTNIFSDRALDSIMNYLIGLPTILDQNNCLKLLEFCSHFVLINFPTFSIVHCCLSISISLSGHSDILISTTSLASFQQILAALISGIQSYSSPDSEFNPSFKENFIQKCQKDYKKILDQFENPCYIFFYLFFQDITNIASGQKSQWLSISKTNMIFDILEIIINLSSDILLQTPDLASFFQGLVIQCLGQENALQYNLSFVELFLSQQFSLCTAVFNDYLERLSLRSRLNHIPLFFFRGIITRKRIPIILHFSEVGNEFIPPLVEKIATFVRPNALNKSITFTLLPAKLSQINNEKGRSLFCLTSPYEIIFSLICSLSDLILNASKNNNNNNSNNSNNNSNNSNINSNNSNHSNNNSNNSNMNSDHNEIIIQNEEIERKMPILMRTSSSYFFEIILSGLKYCDLQSFNIVLSALKSYFILANKYRTIGDVEKPLRALSLEAGEKSEQWITFLLQLAQTTHEACTNIWTIIFNTLLNANQLPPVNFMKDFPSNEKINIVATLLTIKPLPIDYITSLFLFWQAILSKKKTDFHLSLIIFSHSD